MELKLERKWKKDTYTIGRLYYRKNSDPKWTYLCNTLEDKDRGLNSSMSVEDIEKAKIYGQTAIPTGKYSVFLKQVSPRFQYSTWAKPYNGCVPRIQNVKGFNGVLIHCGNFAGKETYYKTVDIPAGKPVYDQPEYVKGSSSFKKTYGLDLPTDKQCKIYVKNGKYEIYTVKDDTLGCVLVGENKIPGQLINSQATFHKLMSILKLDEDGVVGLEIVG